MGDGRRWEEVGGGGRRRWKCLPSSKSLISLAAWMPSSLRFFSMSLERATAALSSADMAQPIFSGFQSLKRDNAAAGWRPARILQDPPGRCWILSASLLFLRNGTANGDATVPHTHKHLPIRWIDLSIYQSSIDILNILNILNRYQSVCINIHGDINIQLD